jgi:signal peptidase I
MGGRTGFGDGRARARPDGGKSGLRDTVETILVCFVFFVFVRAFVFQQSEIPSGSMEPTVLIGDYVLVNRFRYAPVSFPWERRLLPIAGVERGDVVVFKHPPEPEQDFIKRVIGLPGETVQLVDGRLYVEGRRVEEPYLPPEEREGHAWGPVRIPEETYFVLGDHRSASADSRVWGFVPRGHVKGRAFVVLFSTQAPRDPSTPPGQVTIGSLLRKIYNLAFHARWDRFLTPIR